MELGEKLKQARLDAGLSQRQLCGEEITRNMLSQIENGSAHPSMKTLQYLASRLGRPMSYFMEDEDPMAAVRDAYRYGRYEEVLDTAPGGDEGVLLQILSTLELAKAAFESGKRPYAVSLLERAELLEAGTVYCPEELARRRLLLSAQVMPERLEEIIKELPDEELLLRAKALAENNPQACGALLDCVKNQRNARWATLRGRAAYAMGDFAGAKHWLSQNEEENLQLLEQCCLQLEDYKGAYTYALRRREK